MKGYRVLLLGSGGERVCVERRDASKRRWPWSWVFRRGSVRYLLSPRQCPVLNLHREAEQSLTFCLATCTEPSPHLSASASSQKSPLNSPVWFRGITDSVETWKLLQGQLSVPDNFLSPVIFMFSFPVCRSHKPPCASYYGRLLSAFLPLPLISSIDFILYTVTTKGG